MKSAIAVVVLIASMVLPTAAAAESVVPPGNSAATQYTEAFPTSGGNLKVNSGINGNSSPTKVLGHRNAQKLESEGAVGHEAAEVAAETAPANVGAGSGSAQGAAGGGNGAAAAHSQAGAAGSAGTAGQGSAAASPNGDGQSPGQALSAGHGSSGLGEVLGQATGSSSGQLGLFLPLIILGTVAWALAYLWRRHQQLG